MKQTSDGNIEVGKEIGTGRVFVSAPASAFDTATKPLSETPMQFLVMDRECAKWLICALLCELSDGDDVDPEEFDDDVDWVLHEHAERV